MTDVLCLGEILVDWVCTEQGHELDQAKSFTKAPGGAPANVAVGLARQGVATGFIGRVSMDLFGKWLKELLESEGIDTTCTVMDPQASTRMAYVVTTASGDRKLAEFSRIACADAQLQQQDLQPSLFKSAVVLHFGSISLIHEPASTATRKAIELAKEHALLVSYDPNVRLGLWPSAAVCKDTILQTLALADMVKINIDELEFLTGQRDLSAAEQLRAQHNLPLLILTLDANGCHFFTAQGHKAVPGFEIQLVEATGAGDGFVSGVITGLLPHLKAASNRRSALEALSMDELTEIFRRANAVGALACTKAGAIPALPRTADIDAFLNKMALQTR
jgi:sugar/nucleoside kinase (ribokinase family)